MKRSVFPVSRAVALAAIVVLAGCAHPEREGHEPEQSNVPSPLADLENGASEAAAASAPTAVDPGATGALDAMADYLRSLRAFEVDANTSNDVVLDNGQNVALLRDTVLKVKRPDRMRADITGNGNVRGMVYDGRHFTIFNQKQGFYARNDAPPTLDEFARDLANTWHIEMPLADLFYWAYGKHDDRVLTSAQAIGLEKVDALWCTHYAFRQQGVDWELWIEQGPRPLPCRMVVTDTTQVSRPRRDVTYHWKLNPVFPASTFAFHPRADEKETGMKPAASLRSEEAE